MPHDITIWKMTIVDKVDYINTETALGCHELHQP